VLYRKHMNWRTTPMLAGVLARNLRRGQINFIRGIMNYKRVYNVEKMLADHARPVRYQLPTRAEPGAPTARPALYIHAPRRRSGRAIDGPTERFVEKTRVGTSG
jgi:hopanoid C-3 methylase